MAWFVRQGVLKQALAKDSLVVTLEFPWAYYAKQIHNLWNFTPKKYQWNQTTGS